MHRPERSADVRGRRIGTLHRTGSLLALALALGCADSTAPVGLAVESVVPAVGPLAGGTQVTIRGTDFLGVTGVTIGGNPLQDLVVFGPTQIFGIIPQGSTPGPSAITVNGPDGSASCNDCFRYLPLVRVTGVSPSTGPFEGGTRVTITGTDFIDVAGVFIGGVELLDRVVVDSTTITGTTARPIDPGPAEVTVVSTTRGSGTCATCFTTLLNARQGPRLVAGESHSCWLDESGSAWCWGDNRHRELGDGGRSESSGHPIPVVGGHHFIELTASSHRTCGLDTAGIAWCWGLGLLGTGPTAVPGGLQFVALTSNGANSCGLRNTGEAYCWGSNQHGERGDGTKSESVNPSAVIGGLHFVSIVAGASHTCALTGGGTPYCWGYNVDGQLGSELPLAERVSPGRVAGDFQFVALTAGLHHTCGQTESGAVYCWGHNGYGQLGDGTYTTRRDPVLLEAGSSFQSISAGGWHTCGVRSTGVAACWGRNSTGQLGDGTTWSRWRPVPIAGGQAFLELAAGVAHSCGMTSTGALYCWGDNQRGQLGNDAVTEWAPASVVGSVRFSTLSLGRWHTCGLTAAAGAAWCWGRNSFGQVGDGTTGSARLAPVPVAGGPSFVALTAGEAHTCGLAADGTAWCWGDNRSGQLGDGTYITTATPTPVAGGLTFVALTAGVSFSCGLELTGQAWCWGSNDWGQLGDGTMTTRSAPAAVVGGLNFTLLSAGVEYACGLTSSGTAYCWGADNAGQTGDGTPGGPRSTPAAVVGGLQFTSLSTAGGHACGLTTGSTTYCWGWGGWGSLGNGSIVMRISDPVEVVGGQVFTTLASGDSHTCGVTGAGVASCWGRNSAGQLGDGTTGDRASPTPVTGGIVFEHLAGGGWAHTCGLANAGTAYCWGQGTYGALGRGTLSYETAPVPVTAVGTGAAGSVPS